MFNLKLFLLTSFYGKIIKHKQVAGNHSKLFQ